MNTKLNLALLLALSAGVFGKMAVAQSASGEYQAPQVQYAVFHPDQSNAAVQLAAERGRDRCDGDHDRDDRGCGWRSRERRYPNTTANNGYWGNGNYRNNGSYGNNSGGYGNNGYYGNSPYYGNTANGGYRNGQRGEYDRNGDFHPFGSNGYYDRNGRWHNGGGWWR